jgi:hypothetical protein
LWWSLFDFFLVLVQSALRVRLSQFFQSQEFQSQQKHAERMQKEAHGVTWKQGRLADKILGIQIDACAFCAKDGGNNRF